MRARFPVSLAAAFIALLGLSACMTTGGLAGKWVSEQVAPEMAEENIARIEMTISQDGTMSLAALDANGAIPHAFIGTWTATGKSGLSIEPLEGEGPDSIGAMLESNDTMLLVIEEMGLRMKRVK